MQKPVEEFKNRFNKAISDRNIKPVELSQKTGLSKSAISQYMSGYAKPKSDKLYILAQALNVNEAWLMGYDVPMDKSKNNDYNISLDTIVFEITGRSLQYSPVIFDALCKSCNEVCSNTSNDVSYTNGTITVKNFAEFLQNPSISYDDKAFALRSIIEIVLYDIKEEQLNIIYTLDDNKLNNSKNLLQKISNKLNITGLNKVLDYATDLSNMDIYVKQSDIVPKLNAAQERTDIDIPEGADTSENGIMDADDF